MHHRPARRTAVTHLAALEARRLFAAGITYEADLAYGAPQLSSISADTVDLDYAATAGHSVVSMTRTDPLNGNHVFVARKYDAAGNAATAELTLYNDPDAISGADVGVAPDGSMVLAHVNSESQLVTQRFNAAGAAVGSEVTTDVPDIDGKVRVAIAPGGAFAVAYTRSWYSGVTFTHHATVDVQRFNADGTAGGAPIAVGDYTAMATIPTTYLGNLAADDDGFAVAYVEGDLAFVIENNATAASFAWDGTRRGAGNVAAEAGTLQQRFAQIALGEAGAFALAWTEIDNNASTVHVRGFQADGTPLGAAIELNSDGLADVDAVAKLAFIGGDHYAVAVGDALGLSTARVDVGDGTTATTNELRPLGGAQPLGGADAFGVAYADDARLALVGLTAPDVSVQAGPALRFADAYLDVEGTGAADQITVAGASSGSVAVATVNNVTTDYAVAEFRAMRVAAGSNDDRVNLVTSPVAATVDLGAGDDKLHATAFADEIAAGDGRDRVWAGAGTDVVNGGAGRDFLYGERGRDLIRGEAGSDHLDGGSHADTLLGLGGNDYLYGGQENAVDKLYGGLGDDVLNGGRAWDRMDGGAGADVGYVDVGEQVLGIETIETWTPTPR